MSIFKLSDNLNLVTIAKKSMLIQRFKEQKCEV